MSWFLMPAVSQSISELPGRAGSPAGWLRGDISHFDAGDCRFWNHSGQYYGSSGGEKGWRAHLS